MALEIEGFGRAEDQHELVEWYIECLDGLNFIY